MKEEIKMRNLNITGCSRIQEILILHKLSNIELPTGCVEITFHQNIEQGKCDSVWYSGDMVTIRYEGYELIINVYGDVAISLYNKKDNCEVARVRDKNSDRLFYKKMKNYIRNDAHLHGILHGKDDEYEADIQTINCYGLAVVDKTQRRHDMVCELDASFIFDAVAKVISNIQNYINMVEKEKKK